MHLLICLLLVLPVLAQERKEKLSTGSATISYDRFRDTTTVSTRITVRTLLQCDFSYSLTINLTFKGQNLDAPPENADLTIESFSHYSPVRLLREIRAIADNERLRFEGAGARTGGTDYLILLAKPAIVRTLCRARRIELQVSTCEMALSDKQRDQLNAFAARYLSKVES